MYAKWFMELIMSLTIWTYFIKKTIINGRDRKDEGWKTAMQVVRSAKAKQKT